MKKIALILVALLMTLACIAIAEETPTVYTSGNYEYILLDDGTAEITSYTGTAKNVYIPENLDSHVVTSIGDKAFFFSHFTEITIPDSVTSIGINPFDFCLDLTKINVSPDHPTLTTIDGVLFDKTEKKLICCPIAFSAKSYSIPQGISSIGDCAFYNCESLTKISIPGSVTFIGNEAFCFCESLTEINIPDSVMFIGDGAFSYCNFTKISIPDSVTSIGINPFEGCPILTKLTISPDHPTLATIDGVLFDKTEKKLICYPYAFSERSYSIPQGISSIGDNAFYDCESLTEINVPDSVTSIGNGAFRFCRSLTEINVPDSVASIGDFAFASCESLTEITIPDSATSIGNAAFAYCDSLTLTVDRDSYAAQYAKDHDIEYTYTDATTNDPTMGFVSFEPLLIPMMGLTAKEWFADSSSRALFTVLLAVDLGTHLAAEDKGTVNVAYACFNTSYIGRNSLALLVYIDDYTHQIIMAYMPSTNAAAYMYVDGSSEKEIRLGLEDICTTYYKNDQDDLLEMALNIVEAAS